MNRIPRLAAALVATTLVAAALAVPAAAHGQAPTRGITKPQRADAIRIPESVRLEHTELHDALGVLTRRAGAVGAAARDLAAVLHPHFVREEQIALPPLGLLAPLGRGERTAAMRRVLPLTDSLRAELPKMLREHTAIAAAVRKLADAARAANDADALRFADALSLHARTEEEVLYPAAVVVGDLVRRSGKRTAASVVSQRTASDEDDEDDDSDEHEAP